MERDQGFTLIELLVVILVIAILAAIAIPVFLAQRQRGWQAQVETTLKNAGTAIESYGAGNEGDFSLLDGADSAADNAAYRRILDEGLRKSSQVELVVEVPAGGNSFCIKATHLVMPAGHEWKTATYNSAGGSPSPSDADLC